MPRIQLWILRRAFRILGIDHRNIGFLVQNFQLISLVDFFEPRIVSFDYIDNAFGFRKLPRHMHNMWLKTLNRSEVITVTSPTLKRQVEAAGSVHPHLIPNGVEYETFSLSDGIERPSDLPQGNPVVGYIGAVNTWFDFDLLRYLLSTMPERNFVVIGREHPETRRSLNSLSSFRNFFFLGFRPYKTIPSYLIHFNAGIIPFKKNELTGAVNPVKLYEYSAAGVPTVTTDFSEDLKEFENLIFVAHSHNEFATHLEKAMVLRRNATFIEKLDAFARENDWNARADTLAALIEQRLQSRQ